MITGKGLVSTIYLVFFPLFLSEDLNWECAARLCCFYVLAQCRSAFIVSGLCKQSYGQVNILCFSCHSARIALHWQLLNLSQSPVVLNWLGLNELSPWHLWCFPLLVNLSHCMCLIPYWTYPSSCFQFIFPLGYTFPQSVQHLYKEDPFCLRWNFITVFG